GPPGPAAGRRWRATRRRRRPLLLFFRAGPRGALTGPVHVLGGWCLLWAAPAAPVPRTTVAKASDVIAASRSTLRMGPSRFRPVRSRDRGTLESAGPPQATLTPPARDWQDPPGAR